MKQECSRIVAGEDFGGGQAPNDIEAEGRRLLALVGQHVRGADNLELEQVTVGMRPMPEDGMPVVGFAPDLPGLYLATMHSGITLAAGGRPFRRHGDPRRRARRDARALPARAVRRQQLTGQERRP